MSFDALLTIVFILFFVVGPILRRLTGTQPPKPPVPGKGTGRAPQPEGPQRGKPTPPTAADVDPDSPLSQRLEEARRRVLEAMGEGGEGGDRPRVGPEPRPSVEVGPKPARTGRVLDWQASPAPVAPFIPQREGPPRRPLRGKDPAPPLRAERRRVVDQAAKLRAERRPALDEQGIINGMIWHEILSEPVSKRGTRRQPSRLRSR